jgi:hypothetical protein
MQEQTKEYYVLLRRLVDLQKKLIRAFETEIKIVPLSLAFPGEFRGQIEGIVTPGRPISQILRDWPDGIAILPLHAWVKPRKGIVQLEGQNWLFEVHGSSQVSFIGLPSGLDMDIIKCLKSGQTDVLTDVQGCGPQVEVMYLKGGRTDGVSAWSVWSFMGSEAVAHPQGDVSSQSDHQRLLEELAREGFLIPWPYRSPEGYWYYVLAESEARL